MVDSIVLLQISGTFACFALIVVYLYVREKGLWAIDGFLFFFLLQYGPHGLWITPFHRIAQLMTRVETEHFLIGMLLAYIFVGIGFIALSAIRLEHLSGSMTPLRYPGTAVLIVITIIYLVPFVATQGASLPITSEYARAFMGKSSYDYDELRRQLFAGSPYEKLCSITRQISTAILFTFYFHRMIRYPSSRLILIPFAILLFTLAAMQMNKFPFVYYFALLIICLIAGNDARSSSLLTPKRIFVVVAGAVIALAILNALYAFQYGKDASEMREVMVYRILYCNSDALRLWFSYFPKSEAFLGPRGIPLTSFLFGTDYVNPTVAVPESLGTNRLTSYQCGFIGSGYAGFGFLGISLHAFLAGCVVMFMTKVQTAFRKDSAAVCVLSVLTLNSYFLTTRELHTAMLSGGTISVVIFFFMLKFIFSVRKKRRINMAN